MHEAMFYSKEENKSVRCRLCHHNCHIKEGEHGICNVRINDAGTLYSIFYGKPIAMAVDPIEKKPFFHFRPASTALSIATPGCNFKCSFCQNWDISQYGRVPQTRVLGACRSILRKRKFQWRRISEEDEQKNRRRSLSYVDGFFAKSDKAVRMPMKFAAGEYSDRLLGQEINPETIVAEAKAQHTASISYTYTEPTIFFEYAYDIAKLAKAEGIANNFVTNGYMTREALDTIKPYLDAANVDLKAFRKATYRKVMKSELDGVLDSIRYIKQLGIWLEVTTLVVPGMNDDPSELKDIANFLVGVGRDIPWHISRFVPHYEMPDTKPTPTKTLVDAYEIGKNAGLRYVYIGNVPGDKLENTYCYNCNEALIKREGFFVASNKITNRGECPSCKFKVDGIEMGKAGQ